jgi:hypothetical protein
VEEVEEVQFKEHQEVQVEQEDLVVEDKLGEHPLLQRMDQPIQEVVQVVEQTQVAQEKPAVRESLS